MYEYLQIHRFKGFTFIEIVITIALIAILSTIIAVGLGRFNDRQALSVNTRIVQGVLEDARSRTLASEHASQYGVHVASSTVVMFRGDMYTPGDPNNRSIALDRAVVIMEVTLEGGGVDVVFERLTGDTEHYGTIRLESKNDPFASSTVHVRDTGLVFVE